MAQPRSPGRTRVVRIAQLWFLFLAMTGVTASLAALGTVSVEWIIVTAFPVWLFTVELGAPTYDRPWWQTGFGLLAFTGFVLYLFVLSRHLL